VSQLFPNVAAALLVLLALTGARIILRRLTHGEPSGFYNEKVLSVLNGIAMVLLAVATVAVLIALPAAIASLALALALALGVTEGSDWIGARINAGRAAQRAASEDQRRPGTATL
jgi:hypothetical protein